MKKINPADLIPMDIFVGSEPIKIDLVYANAAHPRNIFETALYHNKARFWAHQDIAKITLLAARKLYKSHGYIMEIQDCLRTVDAQEAMQETSVVKAHPEWMEEPDRLLAPPGAGGHPRGMAIDVRLLGKDHQEIDMGTPFDYMEVQSHRTYTDFPDDILQNRKILEAALLESAAKLDFPFIALQSEWWDFRFPSDYAYQFEALRDENLPLQMQMTAQIDNNIENFSQEHFDKLAEGIINVVNENI